MKKLKISIISLIGILVSIYFISCSKDSFTEKDALNLQYNLNKKTNLYTDSITASKYKVIYSVNLVDADLTGLKAAKAVSAISSAVVEVTQNGKVYKKTVDSTGIAVFDTLKYGLANVNVTLSGYSTVNYLVDFTRYTGAGISGGIQISNIIPMIPLNGTTTGKITGLVTCQSDLTNGVKDPVPTGTKVMAMVSTNSSAITLSGSNSTLITNISYDNLSLNATTQADGSYSISVPATVNGLSYTVSVDDILTSQKLLMATYNNKDTFGVITVPTNFGMGVTSLSTVAAGNAVYVTITAPDYNYTPATATVVLGNGSGIDNIQVTHSGAFYTSGTTFNLPIDTPYFAGTATPSPGSASFTVNNYGQVSGITSTAGNSYSSVAVDNLSITIPYFLQEATFTVDTGNNNAAVTSTNVTLGGKYFINDPTQITIVNVSGNGSGAILTPNFTYNVANKYYSVSSISINKGGSGYAHNQKFIVRVSTNLNNPASGIIHLQSGVVSAIRISNQGANYVSGKVNVIISSPGSTGTTATIAPADVTVVNGKITAVKVTSGGSGYTSVPTIKILSTIDKIQAKASATVTKGVVTAISLDNAGSGYLNVPTVSINSSIGGIGSGASAIATVGTDTKVASLTIQTAGSGYFGVNNPTTSKSPTPTSAPSVTVKGSGTTIQNFYLGTGKRQIEQ